MATELPRPGVEVVQEFQSTSPTIVTPTLVPCIVAPFYEVLEVLNSDGTINSDSKLDDLYEQFEVVVPQSSFPDPRGNLDELDIVETSIRGFFDFGGAVTEVSQEAAFLTTIDAATDKASVTGSGTGPFDIDGLKLVVQFDSHTGLPPAAQYFPVASNIAVTFSATTPGGTLTIDEVVNQVNAIIPGVASSAAGALKLTSARYGARSSVVVRYPGHNGNQGSSAASQLGFDLTEDEFAVGPGLYAVDDGDSDATSPRLEVYEGVDQGTISSPGTVYITAPDFTALNIQAGDSLVASGVVIGEVAVVQGDRLTMEVEQNLLSASSPFAPRYVWVRANNLSYPAPTASQAATITGTGATASATQAYIVGVTTPTFDILVGQSLEVDVVEGGVVQDTETIVVTSDWTSLSEAESGINAAANKFQAYICNSNGVEQADGTYIGLRTLADNTGSDASITLSGQTAGMTLGFTTPPYSDVGENVRYLPGTPAFAVGASAFTAVVMSETVVYTPTVKNPTTGAFETKSAETITWAAGHATIAAAISDWNGQAAYTEAYEANVSGVETPAGGYFAVRTMGESRGESAEIDVTATDSVPTLAVATYNGTDTDLDGLTFKWSIDNNPKVYEAVLVSDEDDGGTGIEAVINKINELTPGVASESSDSPPYLKLTSQKVGEASALLIGAGTSNTVLGFTGAATATGSGRPAPDLAIGTSGEAIFQGQLLRNGLTGIPFDPGFSPLHVAYEALRLDVSPEADNPALLVISDIDDIDDLLNPVSTDNPGALMMYLAKLNAPTASVAAIGVPEISADAPEGTPLGYSKALEFLQNEEVYAVATASHSAVVHQNGITHVTAMSEPEQKGERIYFFNPEIPTRATPTSIGSGTDANSTATANELTIDVNIAPALIALGIDPDDDINPTTGAIENEVYVDLGSDDAYYLVQAVDNGTKLTLRTTFATGDGNSDSFFSTDALPSGIISDNWSVYLRGAELVVAGSTSPDNSAVSETVQTAASAYGERRGYYVFPDQCGINVSGLEQLVPGYYMTAAIAGLVGQQPPQQGFTNYPMAGFTKVVGSNDRFTNSQLNVMAAGGTYIMVQEATGAPISCRHQLSTDLTSIETRELSITKVVDYVAKFMRAGLRNFIGRSNITQPFLDQLSTVVQGLLYFLQENGVIIGGNPNNLIQDADNPDTVLVDVTLDVPYPCNYIRIVLVV